MAVSELAKDPVVVVKDSFTTRMDIKPGLYKDLNIEEYHASEGISNSGISLILDCPKRYWQEYLSGQKREMTADHKLGIAFHCLLLEPEKFHGQFHLAPEITDLRLKHSKVAMAEIEEKFPNKIILRGEDAHNLLGMEKAAKEYINYSNLKLSDGNKEHSIYWDGGISLTRLKSRPDFYNDNLIIDIKTHRLIPQFKSNFYSYGYHRQAAMQIDALATIDDKVRKFFFFVIEKKPPYLIKCFDLKEEDINVARQEYLEGAAIYSECNNLNIWNGYEKKIETLSIPTWHLKKEGEENV